MDCLVLGIWRDADGKIDTRTKEIYSRINPAYDPHSTINELCEGGGSITWSSQMALKKESLYEVFVFKSVMGPTSGDYPELVAHWRVEDGFFSGDESEEIPI